MECTNRYLVILVSCLMLLSIVQETSQGKQVSYILGRPAENCTYACASRGMSCIEVGAFPSNALSIFSSLNVSCSAPKETSVYHFTDHPNYCISGGWKNRCMGFKISNANSHFTLCGNGSNPTIRRLCPCKNEISTTDASSTTILSPTTTPTTLPSSRHTEITSTTAKLLGTQTRSQYTGDKAKLNTWVIVVIAFLVILVISGLFGVVIFVIKKRKTENNSPPRIRSAPEQMSKNKMNGSENIVYMESMVDMNMKSPTTSSTTRSPTENILYESGGSCPYEPGCELNELYVLSCEDENQTTMMTTANPIYGDGESVADEYRHECRGIDNTTAGVDDEYASIDDV